MSDPAAAAREARQEAGVTGKISHSPWGNYRYRKVDKGEARLIDVTVYLLRVEKERKRWREKAERQRAWFDIMTASRKVREPKLRILIAVLAEA
jgi:8-oxo-dGTP pyrophosphatase MutT (NUDIX family)